MNNDGDAVKCEVWMMLWTVKRKGRMQNFQFSLGRYFGCTHMCTSECLPNSWSNKGLLCVPFKEKINFFMLWILPFRSRWFSLPLLLFAGEFYDHPQHRDWSQILLSSQAFHSYIFSHLWFITSSYVMNRNSKTWSSSGLSSFDSSCTMNHRRESLYKWKSHEETNLLRLVSLS